MDERRTNALLALVDAVRKMLAEIEKTGKDGKDNYDRLISTLTLLLNEETAGSAEEESAPTAKREEETLSVSETAIRVDVGLLDRLMNLVGELVLARNQILQFSSTRENPGLGSAPQRLSWITSELQEGIMKTRMQPIGNVWSKFPRMVRDLEASCGKKVRLEMEGKETELDKTLIEAIKDPLTHIIRNSIDHGIESPEKRRRGG
jgi:two-component system, chemotaxis family, sensor kinase CheA